MFMSARMRRLAYRCLLATELMVLGLLAGGGCYSRQNYHVLSPEAGDQFWNKCSVVVEGRIVYVRQRRLPSWTQRVFFCFSYEEEPQGPDRFDVSIDIDNVLKGDANMPRRLQINNCRPLTSEESAFFAQAFFPNDLRVRVGYNHGLGNRFRNLTVLPLSEAPTTPSQ